MQICANLHKTWNNTMLNDDLIIQNMDLSHIHLAVLFFCILEKLKTPQSPFEINWPLLIWSKNDFQKYWKESLHWKFTFKVRFWHFLRTCHKIQKTHLILLLFEQKSNFFAPPLKKLHNQKTHKIYSLQNIASSRK